MARKRVFSGSMLAMALLFGTLVYGQGMNAPKQDISAKKHPNLAAAQRHCDMAFEKIQAAQAANEWDLDGHAKKAKELLDEANKELKQSAEASNKNHK